MKKQVLSLAVAVGLCASMTAGVSAAPVQSVDTGSQYGVMVKEDGTLWAWGQSAPGVSVENWMEPVEMLDQVSSAAAGPEHTLAIREDGSLWSWGANSKGQLGDGTTADRTAPAKVMENVASACAGYGYSLALKQDGTVWVWGMTSESGAYQTSAQKVMDGVQAVCLGGKYAMALKTDGTLWSWGSIAYLPNGGVGYHCWDTPQLLSQIVAASNDGQRPMEITTDGKLWGIQVDYLWTGI